MHPDIIPRHGVWSWRWWLGLSYNAAHREPPRAGITVIVSAYNEEKTIASTLASIFIQTYPITRIIVVDDCSTDSTSGVACRARFSGMRAEVVKTPHNTGTKSAAQNFGLTYVETEFFVGVDGDTVLAPDAIECALRYMNDPVAFAVSGFVTLQKTRTFFERGRFVNYLFGQTLMKHAQNNTRTIFVASGCFTIFRTALVRELGGFRKRTVAEDMDITWEAMGRGYHIYFARDAVCSVVDPPTFHFYVRQMDRWFRGFMQNVMIRRTEGWQFFRHRKKIAILTMYYVGSTIVDTALLPFALWWWVQSPLALLALIALDCGVIALFALPRALRFRKGLLALRSLPAAVALQYLDRVIFFRALWKEVIRKEALAVWHKGH